MRFRNASSTNSPIACDAVRAEFSAYLDGTMNGVEMKVVGQHLNSCFSCDAEFAELRSVQSALSALGPVQAPARLQAQLRETLALERERGTHLSLTGKLASAWHRWLAAATLRIAGGATAAIVLLGTAAGVLSGPLAVQANDDNMAHLVSPRYLYSQVPPRPLDTGRDVPVLVDAQVDANGRVYDYQILAGPKDPSIERRVQENLLASVFKPATAFGVPVAGHVIMTYSGVSVHG